MRASKFIILSTAALLAGGATQTFASSPTTSGSAAQVEPNAAAPKAAAPKAAAPKAAAPKAAAPSSAAPSAAAPNAAAPKGHVGMGEGQQHRGEARQGDMHQGGAAAAHGEAHGYVSTLSSEDQMRLREMVHTIPRLTNIGETDIRIDGYVPRTVRQAAAPLPAEVQQMHPRFRRDRAFRYRDQVVILNPMTSRIVALVKTPS